MPGLLSDRWGEQGAPAAPSDSMIEIFNGTEVTPRTSLSWLFVLLDRILSRLG